jgi:DNA invertase Pin-like site-specific DNA recombinase
VLDFLREGDVLMVTRIDRLARSIGDLQDIGRAVRARGASLKATEQPSTPACLPARDLSDHSALMSAS